MLLLRENVYKITAADKMRRGFIRVFFLFFHRKLRPMKQKRSARIAVRRQRILSQKRPAAGGEARERASLFLVHVICWQNQTGGKYPLRAEQLPGKQEEWQQRRPERQEAVHKYSMLRLKDESRISIQRP